MVVAVHVEAARVMGWSEKGEEKQYWHMALSGQDSSLINEQKEKQNV